MSSMSGAKRKASSEAEAVEEVPTATGGGDQPLPGKLGADLLSRLRNDPHLCDVTLVGSDGGRVQATRAILVMRSRVFERMLMGDFKEGGCDEIEMAYSSVVVGYVVEYCYSDEVQGFGYFIRTKEKNVKRYFIRTKEKNVKRNFIRTKEENVKREEGIKMIRSMVTVVAAADFFELKGLYSYVEDMLKELIARSPWQGNRKCFNACVIWDESLKCASLMTLQARALRKIEQNPRRQLLSGKCHDGLIGVAMLSPESLVRLLEDDSLLVHAETLFHAIMVWSKVEDHDIQKEERMEVARKCASTIELRFIPAEVILHVVSESGLIDPAKQIEVLKEQQGTKSVYVHKAGSPEVNGWYKESETKINGWTAYVKCDTSKLDGEIVRVYICHAKAGNNGYYRWTISAPPIGEEAVTGTDADRVFYVSRASSPRGLEHVSSADDWLSGALGSYPPPRLMLTKSLKSY
eukprot:CAMPEP_0178507160 /NCGR_PEP_ID=MMETSP0696-20121128/20072_1 /TAXON_ID=265572 /ORGANISM="Extubocellulus spinifer, Strain CCMP396" /LENGTH=462 /DNA_ID=CAMNT_0020136631 /DNA_START=35 /DNA_END=1423 /DNA_ORIENTATION=-